MKPVIFIFTLSFLIALKTPASPTWHQTTHSQAASKPGKEYRHALDFCPISPLFDIYALQYFYSLSPKDRLILGLSYANIQYDEGRSHAPGLILGYKRYLWRGWHLEHQFWPAFNDYFETSEKKYYSGFELWNEFRTGYTFDFQIKQKAFYFNLQALAGFGLYQGNKPKSFQKQVEKETVFISPVFFLGWRF